MENNLKQRHGCITAWLWFAILANITMTIYYAAAMFEKFSTEITLGLGICSIFGVLNVLGAILLMRWIKTGYYLFVFSSLIAVVVNVFILNISPVTTIISLSGIIIWWAILQIKKNGVSAWSQLKTGWDYKHCRHLYQVFSITGIILFVLTLIIVGIEHKKPHNNNIISEDTTYTDEDTVAVVQAEPELIIDSLANDEEDNKIVKEPVKPQPKKENKQQSKKEKDIKKQPEKEVDVDYSKPIKKSTTSTPSTQAPEINDSDDLDKHLRFLKQIIQETNKSFPQKAGEGLIMKRCYLDGDYVMYLSECDEDLYDMDLLNANKSQMKQAIIASLQENSDSLFTYAIKSIIKAQKGIGIKYQGDTTGESCIIRISYSELKDF